MKQDAPKMERFWCVLHQENEHGASEKNILVHCRFLNDCKEKIKHFWRSEMLAICAIVWCILRSKKTHEIPIAQAVPEWCITEKAQYPNRARLGLSVFPVEFHRDFFEQCELSSKLSIAKKIILKRAFFMKRSSPKRL